MSRFFQKSIGIFFTQVFCTIIALMVSIIIARGMGPEGKGAYSLLTLIISMISSFGTLGIGMANVYFVGKKRRIEEVAANSLLLSAIMGGIIIVASLFFLHTIADFVNNIATSWFILALFGTVPLRFACFYLIEVILGLNKIKIYNIFNILGAVLNLTILGLVWFFTKDVLTAALLAFLFTPFGLLLFTLVQVWRVAPIKLRINFGLLKESLSFGIKGHIGNIFTSFHYRADMFLLGLFQGSLGVGYYSTAVGLAEQIWLVPDVVAIVLFPRVASSEESDNNRTTSIVCRHTLFLSLLLALGLLALGGPLITLLYGEAFRPSIIPMFILLPGIVALGMSRVLSSHVTGSGRPQIPTYVSAATLVVNIGLNLVLIPRWGVSGAAIASTISYSLGAAILTSYFLRMSKYTIGDTLLIKISDIGLYVEEFNKLLVNLFNSGKWTIKRSGN